MTDIARLGLEVTTEPAVANVNRLDQSLDRVGRRGMSVKSLMSDLGITLSAGLTFRAIIRESSEAQDALAQLEAGIESTGGAAGRSTEELVALSEELQRTTKFSDEAVQGVEALLLTFTRIRGPEFDDAVGAIADMATRMKGDLQGAALQVGKALNDPILGVTALGRAGVQFTETQKEMIKTFVETNRVVDAQRIILDELETQFGGSAEAARDTLGGSIEYLKNQMGDFFEVSESGSRTFIDAFESMGDAVPKVRRVVEEFLGGIQLMAAEAAVKIGELELAFARMNEDESTVGLGPSMRRAFGGGPGGQGRGILDPFGWDLFSRGAEKMGVDVGRSVAEAEANLARLREAANEVQMAMFEAEGPIQQVAAAIVETATASAEGAKAFEDWLEKAAEAREKLDRKRGEQIVDDVVALREERERILQARADAFRDWLEEGARLQKDAAEEEVRIYAEAAEEIQEVFADAFGDIFSGSLDGFEALADNVLGIFQDLAAEIAATMLAKELGLSEMIKKLRSGEKLTGAWGIGASVGMGIGLGQGLGVGGGTLGGAASGFAVAGPWGALAGGVAGFVSGLFDSNEDLKRARAEWKQTLEDFIGLFDERTRMEEGIRTLNDAFAAAVQMAAAAADVKTSMKTIEEARAFLNATAGKDLPEKFERLRDELGRLVDAYEENERAVRRLVAEEQRRFRDDLRVRLLEAQGMDDVAAATRQAIEHQREWAEAIAAGFDKATLEVLRQVQAQEKLALATEQAKEALREQTEEALRAAEEQERAQEIIVGSLRDTVATLREFLTGLGTSPLAPLSPTARLSATRSEFETALGLARGGDQDATRSLPGLARALLEASREVNASGVGFVRDFEAVQAALNDVLQGAQSQLTVEERILEELVEQTRILEETRDQPGVDVTPVVDETRKVSDRVAELLRAFGDADRRNAALLQSGFLEMVNRLIDIRVSQDNTASAVRTLPTYIGTRQLGTTL